MASAPAQVAPASALVAAPPGCSFSDRKLVLGGTQLPFVRYERDGKDEIWFPAKPVMRVTGETNITHCLEKVVDECKMSFKELVAVKGLPQEGCHGFDTTPDPNDYHEGRAMWVDESGFYAVLLGSRKPQCASFQRWVLQEVLPSIRRCGAYVSPGSRVAEVSPALLEALMQIIDAAVAAAVGSAVAAAVGSAAASAASAAVAQVQQQHDVLEISRSSGGAQSAQLQRIGTPVDDGQRQLIALEGGPLYVSEFLREMQVAPELRRRLAPSFAAEAAWRKLRQWQAGGGASPLWTAWSHGAWQHFYTEADRPLLSEVFEDPLTQQQLEALARGPALARPAAPVVARRRQGPYTRPLQGSSSAVSPQGIRRFFGPAA